MKGIIKTITHNGKWTKVTLQNGEYTGKELTGNSEFDARFKDLKEGQEIDFTVKDDKWINLTKEKKGGAFPAKDYKYEKRKTALEASVNLAINNKIEVSQILKSADKFLAWLQ